MKLNIKYLFPTLSSGVHFYVYKLPEGLGMKKILAYSISMQKNSPIKEGVFWIFTKQQQQKSTTTEKTFYAFSFCVTMHLISLLQLHFDEA